MKATAYLQIEPEWSRYGSRDKPASVVGAKVVGMTQKRSRSPRPGVVEVAITIDLPAAAFVPLRPEATVVIPESMSLAHPIEVDAIDPNAD